MLAIDGYKNSQDIKLGGETLSDTQGTSKKQIKSRLYYFNKQSSKPQRLHDSLYRDLAYVTRANDAYRRISPKARILLANLVQMILRNIEREEFIDHDFLSSITYCRSNRQNRNILNQLAGVINYEYHNCINFQGRRRIYGYIIRFTVDGEERIQNPELFYDFNYYKLEKNDQSRGNKFPVGWEKISTSYIDKKENNKEYRSSRSSKSSFNEISLEEECFVGSVSANQANLAGVIASHSQNNLDLDISDEATTINRDQNSFDKSVLGKTIIANHKQSQSTSLESLAKVASTASSTKPILELVGLVNKITTKKKLIDFHPLTEEDAVHLRGESGRGFNLSYINQLLLKLSKEKPGHDFFTKDLFLQYMARTLSYELREASAVNKESFRFKQDKQEADKEGYLRRIEDSQDRSMAGQLKRKIAGCFDATFAYQLLTSCFFSEQQGENGNSADNDEKLVSEYNGEKGRMTYRIIQDKGEPVELSAHQREILLKQVQAVCGDHIEEIEIIRKGNNYRASNIFSRGNEQEVTGNHKGNRETQVIVIDSSTVWGRIRAGLVKTYGQAVDKNWFSTLLASEDQAAKKLILKAPTEFFGSYIRQNYLDTIRKLCERENFKLASFN